MNKLLCILTVLTLLIPSSAAADSPAYVSRTAVERGEKWWGINITENPLELFSEPFTVSTADSPSAGSRHRLMLSSNGRFIYSAEPMEVEFDGAAITIGSNHEKVTAVKAGKTLRDAYIVCCHRNFPPEGTPPGDRNFSMPTYYCGQVWGGDEVLEYADQILARGLMPGMITIANWRSIHGYRFDRELFPDMSYTTNVLHSRGFRLQLQASPTIIPYGRHFHEMKSQGLLIHDAVSGKYYYDWNNPGVMDLIQEFARIAGRYGIDSFCVVNDSPKGKKSFGTSYAAKANLTPLMSIYNSELDADDYSATIKELIASGLSGRPFNSLVPTHLIADGGEPSAERVMSYNSISASMPTAQFYIPGEILRDERHTQALAALSGLRQTLADYIISLVHESEKTGEPLIRHMEYQFPKMGFADCHDQFMLGPRYLFAPAPEGQQQRMVRLPKGVWTDSSGRRFRGPLVTRADCRGGIPVWFELTGK